MGRRSRRRRQRAPSEHHGIALIDKPEGVTSREAVDVVKRRLGAAKAGHTGTLDPAASGLLVVLLEEATKLSPWLMGHDKRYEALVRFGTRTDTLDREGEVVEEAPVPPGAVTVETVTAALPVHLGDVMQVPPIYAAIKRGGRTLMSRARAGEDFEPEPRAVTCHALAVLEVADDAARLHVHCGSGYYVRSLARDLGRSLGLPAHLGGLRRTHVAAWSVEGACGPDEVSAEHVVPLARAVPGLPLDHLDEAGARAIRHGQTTPARVDGPRALALAPDGVPIAMVERTEDDRWKVARGLTIPALSIDKAPRGD